MSHFLGHFEGASTFLTLEMAHKVIVPPKKNYIPQFLKQRDINSYYSFAQAPIPLFCDYLLLVPGPGVRIEQDGHSPTGLFAPSLDMPPPKVPRRVQVWLHPAHQVGARIPSSPSWGWGWRGPSHRNTGNSGYE